MDARPPFPDPTTSQSTTPAGPAGNLRPDEYRAWLHRIADWAADYRERIESLPVSPRGFCPGDLLSRLPPEAPEGGEDLAVIFRDFEQLVVPGLVHWGHPTFLGYFGSTATAPGVLAELLAASLNVGAFAWRVSPAATELETLVLHWLRGMLGLPPEFEGVVYDSASVGIVHALAAAREAAGYGVRREGLCGRADVPRLTLYASDQAHSSVEKAAIALGLGETSVRRVPTDAVYAMDPTMLREVIQADGRAGHRPLAVVATVGTTSTAAVDPVPAIAAICREGGIWLHVDAAYGGAMALLPEGRWVMEGVDAADSVIVNPHKWLFVPFDFSALYTRWPGVLRETFRLVPEYLTGDAAHDGGGGHPSDGAAGSAPRDDAGSAARDDAGSAARDYMDYGIQLGRRFRALKAWFVWRAFGRAGLEERVREHRRLARLFASWVEADPGFELMAPVTMSVVCFRAVPTMPAGTATGPAETGREAECTVSSGGVGRIVTRGHEPAVNALNARLREEVDRRGGAYVNTTSLRGATALRVAICNESTTERHLVRLWKSLGEARRELDRPHMPRNR